MTAPFASVLDQLATGRGYGRAETGELRWDGPDPLHPTTVVVPASYDPARKHPVRVFLHGGLSRRPDDPDRPRRLDFSERYLALYPTGSLDLPWWSTAQLLNLRGILDRLKRTYNVDENRVQLVGVSDGGSAAFFVGMKDPTPWSSFVSLNGFLRVLASPRTGGDGELFTANLGNRPVYAVNGELDRSYPAAAVAPYMAMLARAGVDVTFRALEGARHDTSWWPREMPAIDAFEEAHPRDPLPGSLSWETERTDRYNRIAWLVIDSLAAARTDVRFDDAGFVDIADPLDFGFRVDSRRAAGREIVDVVADSPAARMGLVPGDAIVRLDGMMIESAHDIATAFDDHPSGTPLVVEIDRHGERLTLQSTLRREAVFAHAGPSGRVDVQRLHNRFEARTRGVGSFTLLLSPAMVDFERPVTVVVNGETAYEGLVEPDVATLLRYAALDADRTMLFGAELRIAVP